MTGDAPFETAQEEQDPTAEPAALSEQNDDEPLPGPVPQRGWFGFTLRELIVGGGWVLAFALSFVPGAGSVLDASATVWTMNGSWVLAIGVPTAAVFLLVLRRLSPEGIRRVGSLGIDQFASVAFSVALVSWAVMLWQQLDLVAATRRSPLITWPLWLEILLMLVLVAVTVFAPLVPGIREDFEERMETLAHRSANPVRPVFARPRPVRARGSVSDPQNEDDVDPGLLHENEVGAAGHVSAAGTTGAAVPGAAGYVPERHRESFLASSGEPEGAPAGEASPADGETTSSPVADAVAEAPTEAIPDGAGLRGAVPEADAVASGSPADEPEPSAAPASDAAEPGTTAPEAAPAGTGRPETLPSDTMTEVLGDLLAPSSEDDTATHAVDVVPEAGATERRSSAPSEQPQPFWALAPEKRVVHDARGDEIFTIGPDAWILVLEDRGGAFVVRHDDGRVGYLHDTENMTRG